MFRERPGEPTGTFVFGESFRLALDEGDVEATVPIAVFRMLEPEHLGGFPEFNLLRSGDGEDAVLVDVAGRSGFDFDEDEFASIVQGDDVDFAEDAVPALGEDFSAFGWNPLGD